MNNASNFLGLSVLEAVLKNNQANEENKTINIEGEDISINQLVSFWIEQHEILNKAKKILKEQPSEDKKTGETSRKNKKRSSVSYQKTDKIELSTGKGKTE